MLSGAVPGKGKPASRRTVLRPPSQPTSQPARSDPSEVCTWTPSAPASNPAQARELITRAVRERGADRSPLAALRALVLGLVAERHPLSAVGEGFGHFWRTVLDSPALRARGREALDEMEGDLAGVFAQAAGGEPGRPGHEARLAAALIVAGVRAAGAGAVARQLGGDPVGEVAVEQAEVLRRTFDALERALPDLA